MFIRKIIFNNYRIYKGIHEISFKENKDKNVSIITGNNGFGKTTFLTSLIWCLYGRQMVDVDSRYKKDISDIGGYKNFLMLNLNKKSKFEADSIQNKLTTDNQVVEGLNIEPDRSDSSKELATYSITMIIDHLSIPSVQCSNVTITRSYNIFSKKEKVEVLIDGANNELTNELGPEIFINDFILPKEIAKFFFFDAETIVSLAEWKSNEEKKNLNKAYTEVLGIKKYEDLKQNLENLRIRFRRKSASLEEKQKLEALQRELDALQKIVQHQKEEVLRNDDDLKGKRFLASQYQEKLIREGSLLSIEELESLKLLKAKLTTDSLSIRSKLKELMELIPFAIAGGLLQKTYYQAINEKTANDSLNDSEIYNSKISRIQQELLKSIHKIVKDKELGSTLSSEVNTVFSKLHATFVTNSKPVKTILGFSEAETNEFQALFDNIKFSFSQVFQNLVKEEKNNRIWLQKTSKKINQAESNESDFLIKKIREDKVKVEKNIQEIEKNNRKLAEDIGGYQREIASKSKVIAELSKKVSLNDYDLKKDALTEKLIERLTAFLLTLKQRKKELLELRIKNAMNTLFHKSDLVTKVEVIISEEYLDIFLYDVNQEIIKKESLSKGEQQLYASSILRALVDESGIEFPIFIDSPLQKLDKTHSKNVICDFYPSISPQVVIFPLLEKELTEPEYVDLLPKVSQSFIIENSNGISGFREIEPSKLFSHKLELK